MHVRHLVPGRLQIFFIMLATAAAIAFVIILTCFYPGNFINLDYIFMTPSGRLLFLIDNPQNQTKTEHWKNLS